MTDYRRLVVAGLAFVALLAVSAPALAQARFTGRVVDPAGDPISGVKVVLRNLDNGQVVELETDDDGEFFRRALTIGRYEVRFEKDGYISLRDERRLGSGQTKHDVVMTPETVDTVGPNASPEYRAAYDAFVSGDRERTIEILEGLVKKSPDVSQALLLLARAHFELGHWPEAIGYYERLIELAPEIGVAYLDLGVAYVETGEIEKATEEFRTALRITPENADVHYNIGAVYLRADRIDEAIEHLTRATELDPDHALAHKSLAFALVRQSDIEGAIEHLTRYLELAPDAADAAEMQALLEQLRGS